MRIACVVLVVVVVVGVVIVIIVVILLVSLDLYLPLICRFSINRLAKQKTSSSSSTVTPDSNDKDEIWLGMYTPLQHTHISKIHMHIRTHIRMCQTIHTK